MRSSLWFVPAVMSAAAVALALLANRLDRWVASAEHGWIQPLFYRGDLEGARTLLGTVAGSMITVAGVTFSVTMVALSLASSQFGPRLLVNFMRDRGNQMVLGTFIATFLYCLVALGRVGVQADLVPAVSASLGLLLAVASVAVLIFFFHHVASTIRAEHVVDVVARDLASDVERLFPDEGDEVQEEGRDGDGTETDVDFSDAGAVGSSQAGYVQAVDESGLVELAAAEDVVIGMRVHPGGFVVQGTPLAAVAPADRLTAELEDQIRRRVLVGRFRTGEQDPVYGIHQLVEVAVRALSPGINDPNTAISCVDWLGSILHRVGRQHLRSAVRRDDEGALRLVIEPVTFEGLVGAAFDQIRQCSYSVPAVAIRMLDVFAVVAGALSDPARAQAVMAQADMLLSGTRAAGLEKDDLEALEERHRRLMEAVEGLR